MNIFNRLKYRVVSIRRSMGFMASVKKEAVRQLIGHTKIIGWENTFPVRSLAIPAEYSPAFIRSSARLYNSIRSKINYPGLATLSITNRCDCSCPHCFSYNQEGNELSLEDWQRIIKEAMNLGVFSFVLTGGEPLLREDLSDIIKAIDPNRAACHMYTNGSLLAERVDELHKIGLRRISVSMDYANEDEHDAHRNRPGLYNKMLRGIEAAQRKKMLIGISTFVTKERFENGSLEAIFNLATDLNVNEVTVYDALPAGKLSEDSNLKKRDRTYQRNLKEFINSWWEKKDAPGIWWYGHISSCSNLGCTGGTSMFNVSHCGEFRPCDFCRTSVGSVHKYDVDELWNKLSSFAIQKRTEGTGCLLMR